MQRLTRDEYYLDTVRTLARRSTCLRRQVGCILIDGRGYVLATGYNGVPRGFSHCNEPEHSPEFPTHRHPHACPGAFKPAGTDLDQCEAIHAEQNALLQCADVNRIHTCYVTASPCVTCTKLLLNTTCRRIVFLNRYPHDRSCELWERAGREWIHGGDMLEDRRRKL